MSPQSHSTQTKAVQQLYDSFAAGDLEAIRELVHPDVELHEPKGIVGGGTLHGFDEIVEELLSRFGDSWEAVSVVPNRYVEQGETVVSLLTWSGTALETGTRVEFPGAHVFDFEDGSIVRWTSYADTALFNEALGARPTVSG